MTKEIYDKCRNPGMVAFAALPDDVRDLLRVENDLGNLEFFDSAGAWPNKTNRKNMFKNSIYRIKESCKPEEYKYCDVVAAPKWSNGKSMYIISISGVEYSLVVATSLVGFDGIEYRDGSGKFDMYFTMNPAYGIPTRVRFKK